MATLELNNVPDDLYERLEQLAAADRVPIAEETVRLLRDAVMQKNGGASRVRSQREILEEIGRHPFKAQVGIPSAVDLIREDRDR